MFIALLKAKEKNKVRKSLARDGVESNRVVILLLFQATSTKANKGPGAVRKVHTRPAATTASPSIEEIVKPPSTVAAETVAPCSAARAVADAPSLAARAAFSKQAQLTDAMKDVQTSVEPAKLAVARGLIELLMNEVTRDKHTDRQTYRDMNTLGVSPTSIVEQLAAVPFD